jgi:acetoin utilization deacetylase AcuC-like enzyme
MTGNRTAIFRSHRFLGHDTGDHVENPGRIAAIDAELARSGLLSGRTEPAFKPAALEAIERVHNPRYVQALQEYIAAGGGWIGGDTYCSADTWETALLASGAGIAAVDGVLDGEYESAFVLARPPGHHATADTAMGFCFFNHVAVAAQHAIDRGLQRIAVIDWDVHHGNGTQDIFYDRDDVLFCSVHQFGLFYPGTGAANETGSGHGKGYTINAPMPAGSDDAVYRQVFDELFHLPIQEFHPELILISAGFDAHEHDPLGGMAVTERGFADLTKRVMTYAAEAGHNRVVAMLEGGYDPRALGRSVAKVLETLDGVA